MLKIIRNLLQQIIDDIDSGNSKISEVEQLKVINFIEKLNQKELSKIESAEYIGVSRATFDNYIRNGLIPKGNKRQGINNLFWSKLDLDKFLENENIRK